MHLFFDTETTGFARTAPLDHPSQPRLVQFAGILAKDKLPIRRCSFLVHPEHVIIPQSATEIHGITTERARAEGIPLPIAVAIWQGLVSLADVIVGHNIKFDLKIMEIAEAQAKMQSQAIKKQTICTMAEATNIVKLPGGKSKNSFKFPKLEECIKFFFNESLDGAHDALVDTEACMRVYYEILKRKAA